MAKKKKGALCVEFDGKRHFICVPAGRAQELFQYLRNHRVPSGPPEPSFSGFDCIVLEKSIDADSVQTLINAWA